MDSSILWILDYYIGIVYYTKGSCMMCLKESVYIHAFKFAAFISNISISAFKRLGADL